MSDKIRFIHGKLEVPLNPIIPFIEGDGTGPDIWRASLRIFDAALEKAFAGKRKIEWIEVLAGEKHIKPGAAGCRRRHFQPSGNILLA
jgi:isocitrate dehydrogenase